MACIVTDRTCNNRSFVLARMLEPCAGDKLSRKQIHLNRDDFNRTTRRDSGIGTHSPRPCQESVIPDGCCNRAWRSWQLSRPTPRPVENIDAETTIVKFNPVLRKRPRPWHSHTSVLTANTVLSKRNPDQKSQSPRHGPTVIAKTIQAAEQMLHIGGCPLHRIAER